MQFPFELKKTSEKNAKGSRWNAASSCQRLGKKPQDDSLLDGRRSISSLRLAGWLDYRSGILFFFCVYLCVSVCLCVCVCVCVRNKERRNRHRALARPLNSRWCHWSIGHWNGGEVGKRRGKPPIDATSWRSAFHGVCFLSNRRVARTTWEQKKLETKNNRDPNRDGTPKTKTQNKTENERSAEKKTTWQTSRRSVCRPITERDGSSAKNFNRRCRP